VGSVLVAVSLIFGPCAGGDGPDLDELPVREVLSSSGHADRQLALATTSLYAENDPWKSYLASESVCPGGERTDLPVERQVAAVACLVNYAREREGLRDLVVLPVLNGASIRKARAIIRCENFAHNPCGGDWTTAVRSTGYPGVFGENLYVASGRWGAPRVAVDAWLNSAPHRANLFRRAWREQGLAVLPRESFGDYTNVAVWVSVLGDR
jgi:uncharacterized protein YkwD